MVKYRSGWKNAIEGYKTLGGVKRKAEEAICKELSKFKLCAKDEIEAGDAFETKVSVLYWLIQKK